MADQQKNRWTWEVPGFEPRKSVEDPKPVSPLARRYSISTPSVAPRAELAKHSVAVKLQSLKDQLKVRSFTLSVYVLFSFY